MSLVKDALRRLRERSTERKATRPERVQKRAAELLQIKPTTLNEMIKRHDIRPRRKRAGQPANGRPGSPVEADDLDEEVASLD